MIDWQSVKIVFFDVDGVLTDGGIYYGPEGQLFKRFNVHDGLGIRRLAASGVKVVFVSGDDTQIVPERAKKLGVEEVHICSQDKASVVREVLQRHGIEPQQACYVGDDEPDVPAMREVGIAVAVPNAHPSAIEAATYVTTKPGGEGAAREVCDLIIEASGTNATAQRRNPGA